MDPYDRNDWPTLIDAPLWSPPVSLCSVEVQNHICATEAVTFKQLSQPRFICQNIQEFLEKV
jgi:hypothetical protein